MNDVTIIGAGPYGLSAGAYLKHRGLRVQVFGKPMEFWADKMPAGMLLRSPREASNIADPTSEYTLEAYESASGTAPAAPLPAARPQCLLRDPLPPGRRGAPPAADAGAAG